MKMRVSIARALTTEPALLLMDEPFAALDEVTRFKLNDDLLALWRAVKRTVVFVTHSVFESVYLSERIVVMTPARPRLPSSRLTRRIRAIRFRTSAEYAALCRQGSTPWPRRRRGERRMNGEPVAPAMSAQSRGRALRVLLPVIVLALGVIAWELVVRLKGIPPYVLPGPVLVLQTLVDDWGLLGL